MGIPSENKNQVNRTRESDDPAAFGAKPMLDEKRKDRLRGEDKRQDSLRNEPSKSEHT